MAMEHVHTNCLFNGAAWGSFFNITSFPFSFCRNRGMLNSQWAVYRCFVRLLYSTCIPSDCFNGPVPIAFHPQPASLIFRDGTGKKECRPAIICFLQPFFIVVHYPQCANSGLQRQGAQSVKWPRCVS